MLVSGLTQLGLFLQPVDIFHFLILQANGAGLSVRITGCPSSVSDRSVDPASGLRAFLPVPDPVAAELLPGLLQQSGPHRIGLQEEDDDPGGERTRRVRPDPISRAP